MNQIFGQKKLVAVAGLSLLLFNIAYSRTPVGSTEQVLNKCLQFGNDAAALRCDALNPAIQVLVVHVLVPNAASIP